MSLATWVLRDEAPRLTPDSGAWVPPRLQSLVARMLDRDPGKRPASGDDVLVELSPLRDSESSPLARRTLLLRRRMPVGALVAAAVVLAAVTALVLGVGWNARQLGPAAPVVAVASGTVVSASFDSTNGRMVRLKHPSGYQSYYLHLSGFASGIRAGAHVDQNDVIGFVGSTGLSTGTHLHYGLTKNGAFVNPLVEHRNMPPGEPVAPSAMAAFNEVRDRALRDLGNAWNPESR